MGHRPRTGEKRSRNRTLKLDVLIGAQPQVRDAILSLRDKGATWPEIAEQSARPWSKNWATDHGGFIDWDALPTHALETFPDLRLPQTTLQRWFDLRVRQVASEVMVRSAQARQLAAAFAKSIVDGDEGAVLNAARDQLMSLLAEDASPKARINATKGLIALAEMMQERRLNDIKERKVAVDERRLVQLEKDAELKRRKFAKEMDAAEKKITRGEALTADDINRIRERVFGIGPAPVAAH